MLLRSDLFTALRVAEKAVRLISNDAALQWCDCEVSDGGSVPNTSFRLKGSVGNGKDRYAITAYYHSEIVRVAGPPGTRYHGYKPRSLTIADGAGHEWTFRFDTVGELVPEDAPVAA